MSFLKKVTQILLLILVALVLTSSCSSTKKNPYYQKRIKASKANTKQLGKNRYYFSDSYQKRLQKSYKRK